MEQMMEVEFGIPLGDSVGNRGTDTLLSWNSRQTMETVEVPMDEPWECSLTPPVTSRADDALSTPGKSICRMLGL